MTIPACPVQGRPSIIISAMDIALSRSAARLRLCDHYRMHGAELSIHYHLCYGCRPLSRSETSLYRYHHPSSHSVAPYSNLQPFSAEAVIASYDDDTSNSSCRPLLAVVPKVERGKTQKAGTTLPEAVPARETSSPHCSQFMTEPDMYVRIYVCMPTSMTLCSYSRFAAPRLAASRGHSAPSPLRARRRR